MKLTTLKAMVDKVADPEEKAKMLAEIERLETEAAAPPPAPRDDKEPKGSPAPKTNDDQSILDRLSSVESLLAKANERAERAENQIQQEMAAKRTKEIQDTVTKAISEGRIAAGEKDKYVKRLENNYDDWSAHLQELPTSGSPKPDGKPRSTDNSKERDGKPSIVDLRERAGNEIEGFLSPN